MKSDSYKRRPTRVVWVGQIGLGGNYPIRVQSMTTSDTKDTPNLIKEIEGLVTAGCEIVRVTVPTPADAKNLPNIRAEMKKRGIKVPLVADIHFTPSVALEVVPFVEKVRINPGNFADKKLFKVLEYTDQQYAEELERIREKFTPLVLKCKEYGVAMRIGTNHGSLSDRIMNRYGDTPEGMVESALEFLRIAKDLDYNDIVLSMKASNVQVMIEAYRKLAERLKAEGMDYPFHLGVTEAGEGEEGRIKSSIGIGSLLEDGIGDTIRVSLTEDAIFEVPVAFQLVKKYNALHIQELAKKDFSQETKMPDFLAPMAKAYERRKTKKISMGPFAHGNSEPIRLWSALQADEIEEFTKNYENYLKTPNGQMQPLEGIELQGEIKPEKISELKKFKLGASLKTDDPKTAQEKMDFVDKIVALISETKSWSPVIQNAKEKNRVIEWCFAPRMQNLKGEIQKVINECQQESFDNYLFSLNSSSMADYRNLIQTLGKLNCLAPVHLRYQQGVDDSPLLHPAIMLGGLLCDGIGDSVQLDTSLSFFDNISNAYNIMQGSRVRTSKTEYISCPSCGRTQFDLQTTTEKIRKVTSHLKGVKVAVMGCVVNGPGEMADADFGYVGTGPKKISLYVGQECVERNIKEEEAVERLIALIKKYNMWVDAQPTQ